MGCSASQSARSAKYAETNGQGAEEASKDSDPPKRHLSRSMSTVKEDQEAVAKANVEEDLDIAVENADDTKSAGQNSRSVEALSGLSAAQGRFESELLQSVRKKYETCQRYSVCSQLEYGMEGHAEKQQESFSDSGAELAGIGYSCRKGLKKDVPNQDAFNILKVEGAFSMYGVYDGHGKKGHDVSEFTKELMPRLILNDSLFMTDQMPQTLHGIYRTAQDWIDEADAAKTLSAALSGTTCTVVIHDHALGRLILSHAGDSAVAIGRYADAARTVLEGVQLTRDHKPDIPEERARIEAAGGRVIFDGFSNHRVYVSNGQYPGLNMSRSLGDLKGHLRAGCSCAPDVSEIQITPQDHILLVCSDGVWEVYSAQDAIDIVSRFGPDRAMEAAQELGKQARDFWVRETEAVDGHATCDDITVLVIYLHHCGGSRQGSAQITKAGGPEGFV